ncbi:Cys-Gln thioester bond-forming surface protein [Kitasatospora sp. NPDC002040]|uniref:Cys-Gln thioester bond-forming surface protein n=1 Tax=Kitasatospora sp. NPDC002040 TaxID=3154661 RepID=UPI003323ABD3
MFHKQGRALARIASVMFASSLLVGGALSAGAAAAEPGNSGTTAKLLGGLKFRGEIQINDEKPIQGGVFRLLPSTETDETKHLLAYCIDLRNGTLKDATYREADWSATSLHNKAKEAAQIKWILLHSFPNLTVPQLQAEAKKAPSAPDLAGLDEDEAAAGTQAAIWHFSDGVTATPVAPDAKNLTKYLIDSVAAVEPGAEPSWTISLEGTAAGKSGALLGPITVKSTAAKVKLRLDDAGKQAGLTITDKDGKAVTEAANGEKIYAKTPAGAPAGQAKIIAEATTEVSVGRAFLGEKDSAHSQTLILAGTKPVPASASAPVNWAPAGPIPAVSAKVECAQGAVVVTAANNGDQDFTFTLSGQTVTVPPGGTKSVPVKVAEDTAYDITVTGPNGFKQQFKGVLNCKTDTAASPSPKPSSPSASPTGPVLANTGGGGQTPLLAGIAGALVIAGAAAVFTLRRRGRHSRA